MVLDVYIVDNKPRRADVFLEVDFLDRPVAGK